MIIFVALGYTHDLYFYPAFFGLPFGTVIA
jgi:hypothetical protein